MSMNPTPNKLSNEDQSLIDKYLKNGGTVTKGKSCTYSAELGISNNQWGQRRPKQKKQKDEEE